jgi:sialate O-acetylesterase
LIVLAGAPGACSPRAPRLAGVFSDNMVLQRGMPVRVWGWSDRGETVTVRFAEQSKAAVAGADGAWSVVLDPLQASAEARCLTVTGSPGNGRTVIGNVLVGEVWLAAGQSNMNWPLRWVNGGTKEIRRASQFPNVRLADTRPTASLEPRTDVAVKWMEPTPEVVAGYAAVPYLFATRLNRELHVPVGILRVAFGATGILPFVPPRKLTELRDRHGERAIPQVYPNRPKGLRNEPGAIYNAMLHPLRGFGLRGMIWYQGEAETYNDDGMLYADKQTAMVAGLREAWGCGEWPFYFVHLPPFDYVSLRQWFPSVSSESLLTKWQAQTRCLETIPNSDMIVITDLGNPKDIHPKDKIPVALRLANLALKRTYGRAGIVAHGPVFARLEVRGEKAIVHFAHADGLTTRDGRAPTCFEIVGKDGDVYPAEAVIEGKKVIVSCRQVQRPVAVRYNWKDTAIGSLCNGAGLPARPFRTDSW